MLVAVAEITSAQGKGSGAGSASGTTGAMGSSVGLHGASSALQSVGNNDPPEIDGVFGFGLKSLGVSLALALTAQTLAIAQALPSGGIVVGGSTSATITSPSTSSMVINQQSQGAIINWQSFGIGSGASVQFVQPNSSASVLNRVQGSGVSQIDGMLSANGRVFIANPNGVVFGNGAYVDVGSLLATTKSISDADFSAGNYKLTANGGTASVINYGTLRANSGFVVLMSDQVRNAGNIGADRIVLGAGNSATLALSNGQVVNINIDAPTAQALVENTGTLSADGGAVILSAKGNNAVLDSVINVQGLVSARQGTVLIDGGSNGVAQINGGTVDVSGTGAGQSGGTVVLQGQRVGLLNGSTIDARGAVKGGTVIVGGDNLGKAPVSVALSEQMVLDATSKIDASGVGTGDGGFVETSGRTITVLGQVFASGGSGTNVSGNFSSNTSGSANTTSATTNTNSTAAPTTTATAGTPSTPSNSTLAAANIAAGTGQSGHWLIDPANITISAGVTNIGTSPTFSTNNNTGIVNNGTLSTALSSGTSITVTTAGTGTGTGTITATNVNITGGSGATLTLLANASINITGSNITSTGTGVFNVNITADQDNSATQDGYVRVVNSNISTNNGTLTIRATGVGGTSVANGQSLTITSSNITAGGAGSSISATSVTNTAGRNAISVSGATSTININGTVNGTKSGTGNGAGISFGTGSYTLGGNFTGTSVNGTGVLFNGAGTTTLNATNNNAFNIVGVRTGGLGNSTLSGVVATRALTINNQGNLNVSLIGVTTATGGNGNGISVVSGNLTVVNNGTSGSVNITGYANASSRQGIAVHAGSLDVKNNSSGNVTIAGQSANWSGLSTSATITLNNSGSGALSLTGISTAPSSNLSAISAGTNFTASNSGTGNLIVNGTSSNISGVNLVPNGIAVGNRLTLNNTANGNLVFNGTSVNGNGINVVGNLNISNTGGGNITVAGVSNASNAINIIANSTISNTNSGLVTITGQSTASTGLNIAAGVTVNASGNVTLKGQSTNGTGIFTNSTSTVLNSGNGTLTLNGSVNGTGTTAVLLGGNLTGTGTGAAKQVILGDKNITLNGSIKSAGTGGVLVDSSVGNITLNNGINATQGNITLAAGSSYAVGITTGDVIRGTAANGSITAGSGTVIIYSGTPNTSNANTSSFQGLVSGASATTTNKAYSTNTTSGAGVVNTTAKLNAFYRIQPTITLNATNQTKIYDGTNAANNSAYTLGSSVLLDGDVLNNTAVTLTYNTSNVGSGLIVGFSNTSGNLTGGALTGTQSAASLGYKFTTNNATGEITALPTPPIVVVPPTTVSPTPAPLPAPSPAPVVKPTALDMGRIDTLSNDASEKGITGSSDRSSEFVKSDDATKQTVRQDLQMGNPLFKGEAPVTSANYECDKNNALKLPAGVQNLATQCGNKDNR